MTELAVLSAGPATSLQDAGRFGWQRFGVGPAGAMDRPVAGAGQRARRQSARAGGNRVRAGWRAPAGFRRQRADCTGRRRQPLKVDGTAVPPLTSASAHDGQTIELATARSGIFFYLAVAGGFAVAPTLGSLSLHHRTGIGGLEGRTLRAGDHLPLGGREPVRSRACPSRAAQGSAGTYPRGARAAGRLFHRRRHSPPWSTATTSSPSRPTAWGCG